MKRKLLYPLTDSGLKDLMDALNALGTKKTNAEYQLTLVLMKVLLERRIESQK